MANACSSSQLAVSLVRMTLVWKGIMLVLDWSIANKRTIE
jgi:hypothetical protein